MRYISITAALAIAALTAGAARAQAPDAARLAELYRAHDCFTAREALGAPASPAPELAFYRGWVAAAFNRPDSAAAQLRRFLASPAAAGDAERRQAAEKLLADVLVREGRYGEAADAYARVAESAADSEKADFANNVALFGALRDVPAQTVSFAGDVDVPTARDRANLITLPVTVGTASENFIFDTGANLSTVVESTARALGLRRVDQGVQVGSVTGARTTAHLAVAPELRIGAATVRNAIFLVFPDSALAFPQIGYQIHGILGQPVIAALGEVTLTRDGRFLVPARPSPPAAGAEPNLCLHELDNLVRVTVAGEPLMFGFDTGAQTSHLYPPYYEAHRAQVEAGTLKEVHIGGAGGMRTLRAYTVAPFALTIGGRTATLPDIEATTEPTGERSRYAAGDIGQDVIGRFAAMTIDYRAMQLRFR
ncbi:aspartyl protease family protein [Longimicrobium sp.]|uniref:aspartyl protease family protein n=1 Tax=Longimicrobium sp. TaxID=2029185 RepID=UPI002CC19E2B|nr:aspartyl protease family protein [Longimicrobium sp.]HSU13636.1 aspartyl protease family protein [Longimicrobium sp.]